MGIFSEVSPSNLYPIIRLNFDEKVFLRLCHIVTLTVNLISITRIRDDVMNGVELDDVKLRYIDAKLRQRCDILRIGTKFMATSEGLILLWISR